MRRIIIAFLVFIAAIFIFLFFQNEKFVVNNESFDLARKNQRAVQSKENYIFVPYWTFTNSISVEDYNNIIYFGISVNEKGIDTNDDGYKKLNIFSDLIPDDKKTFLTLRVLDKDIKTKILSDKNFQTNISNETILLAKKYRFDGIVLDFETSAFGFESTQNLITSFYKNFASHVNSSGLQFITTLFGDTYYRARPYDVQEIALASDRIIIMAYDFHKARLAPGPNFPFSDKKKYGYSFQAMIDDFLEDVPLDKVIVAFGFFGYDWTLDDNGVSIDEAQALSLNQIRSRFIDECLFDNCATERNYDNEGVVKYKDDEGYEHEAWFEDEISLEKKIEFLKSAGIRKIAIWAYSYY